ncbi:MAG TPA: arginine deiminase-related protein, partial [Chitinophagales bacterium]|nr:arginine deiminase-related protein [Chitinophagales bacterium]
NIVDLTFYTKQNIYLEGTGSILFDHLNKIAYACLSPRTNQDLFEQLCIKLGYQAFSFSAYNEQDVLIYHTNVMLTIGDKFAVICLESIKNELERNTIKQQLEQTGHEIIDINFEQMNAFAGNMLQVENEDGKTYLVMSETSYDSLNIQQIKQINKHTSILSVEIPTIEQIGGGSARCMLAEIYLAVK